MTTIEAVRGDSAQYRVFVTDENDVAVNLTGAIVRFAVKAFLGEPNSSARVFKSTYFVDEISFENAVGGELLVKLAGLDTADEKPGTYAWGMDVVRLEDLLSTAGSASVIAGSRVIVGAGLELANLGRGDVIRLTGANPANNVTLAIVAVGGDGSPEDPGAGNVLTDYSDFVTETGLAVSLYRGNIKSPKGLSGDFILTGDTVL